SLNITVDKKQMLLEFSSKHLSAYNKCDQCYELLCDGTDKSKSKSSFKEIIEADDNSPQDQKIVNKDDILEVLRKISKHYRG
ncbi:28197_t:CDS:2, partial [Racocetra persica]